ncbi:uncharacterized protein PAC_19892 [Phialocephala subalpina]|uniref:AB hydrolase-1 domain-containing protein n=1 Tax=Phialocephala subalpina TaxID=576137 RepID=A0A1L7XY42_9HELO|nr:uncharacterized protein PAC_19892 [Phialocephala subalpina]
MLPTMKTALTALAATLAGNALAAPQTNPQTNALPPCTNVVIPVTVTANNVVLPATTPPAFNQVSGTYNIAARYCEPANNLHPRRDVLQVLVHGITYTRNYWSGDGDPNILTGPGAPYGGNLYSWVDFASQQGYPTLSIDRLGNGLSDHPDPITVLQIPIHIEVIHQIITKARAGSLPSPANRNFDKIIYAGHSFGSVLGNGLNVKYPTDADATILTGLSATLNYAFLVPWVGNGDFLPAATVNSSKWSTLNTGYLALTNRTAFNQAFYYPTFFDQALQDLDYANRGTVGLGELESGFALPEQVATNYKNPVYVITGQHDATMCPGLDPLAYTKPYQTYDCGPSGTGTLAQTKKLYPNANYQWYAPPASGHCWHFHSEALATFGVAHNWLNWNGF